MKGSLGVSSLNPPAAVVEATAAYLESEDAMSAWIADRCELRPSFEDTTANLFKSWKEWAELMGEHALSLKGFGRKLGNRPGLDPKEIGHAKLRGWRGIRVLTVEAAQAEKRYWDD